MNAAMTEAQFVITFSPPDAGWIDMTIIFGDVKATYNLSNVYDPFYDGFTGWLEEVCENGHGKMTINDEREYIDFEVTPGDLPGGCVLMCIEAQFRERVDFSAELPLRDFVSVFYASLTGYWESEQLRKNWAKWVYPDDYVDEQPIWDDDLPSEPWTVRSEKVERWLEMVL